MHPVCADWQANLEDAVARAAPDVVLVAHSLGCLLVAHWSARTRRRVGGALLVAAPDPLGAAFPANAQGFAPVPRVRLPFPSIVVASSDDLYAHIDFARTLARDWGSDFLDVGAQGHINADSGLGDWKFGRRLLRCLRIGRTADGRCNTAMQESRANRRPGETA